MSKQRNTPSKNDVRLRIRILHGSDVALGPGKVELLELVEKTGSITKAAKKMDMSYMRAWTLIRMMNGCFKEPVVLAARGGKIGGGARLTATGKAALELYRQMDRRGLAAVERHWAGLQKLLRDKK